MIDATNGYDPMKPLIVELPMGYSYSLDLVREESNFIPAYFQPSLLFEKRDYVIVFKIANSEKRLRSLDFAPHGAFPGLIVNQKILDILYEVCPNDFQVVPVIIKSKSEKPEKQFVNYEYYFVHPIKNVDVVDFENSDFLLFNKEKGKVLGNVFSPSKVRFKANCMGETAIARILGMSHYMVVSQEFFHLLQSKKVTGIECMPDWLSSFERIYRGKLNT